MKYRKLGMEEIAVLTSRRCSAKDWNSVLVAEDFNCSRLEKVTFSGEIRLGSFKEEFVLPGGMVKSSGLYNVCLHNCSIGNDVLIENIANYIANYEIGDGCFIQNVNLMVTEGVSSFGNGLPVSVLNETGGREVPLFDGLTAQLAYMLALYRHYPKMIGKIKEMIGRYATEVSSSVGKIGAHCRITNTNSIRNVTVGSWTEIEGACRLSDGSICSREDDPVYVGYNVIAEDFIIAPGARLTDGATLSRCFVGHACELGHLFSAQDSLFFSNCNCKNGEACAVFAGPYTVTMHKSSLLIACMTSFLNAGSGSNQSNHLYKSGPIHQGIIERGTKTTSNSYVLWPAKVGPFSLIMGRHVAHTDSSDFPFSYLIERKNQTYLVPGVNLKSIGTVRDAQKWPRRDNRKGKARDCINFNLLSPYTVRKMMDGLAILDTLQEVSGETTEEYSYQRMHIRNAALKKGMEYYRMAIQKFLGNSLIKRLENTVLENDGDIRRRLEPDFPAGQGKWIDLAGLIAPQEEISRLIGDIEEERVTDLEEVQERMEGLHRDYYRMEWTWAWGEIGKWYGISLDSVTAQDVIHIVESWKDSVTTIDRMLYEDTRKEFSMAARTGFGADGSREEQEMDFEQVRGDFEDNTFVKMVVRHIEDKTALGDELLARLKKIPVRVS